MSGLGLCVMASACSTDASPEIRNAVALMLERGWSQGEIGVFDRTLADSVTFHYAGTPRRLSREEMGAVVLRWREAFPDLRIDVEELIVQDDLAAVRARLAGTHEGPWNGAEPTGERVGMSLMMFMRFEGGVMVELWESDDQLGFRRQLGLIPR